MKKLLVALMALSTASVATATVVQFTGSPASSGRFIAFGSQVPIGNGNLIRVGSMTGGNPATFQEFGTTTTGTIGQDSKITGGPANNVEDAGDAAFNGLDVYIWVYNAPTAGAATQQAIFRATANTPAWVFPVDGGITDTVTLSITGINQVIQAPGYSGGAIIAANAANSWGNLPGLQLGAIPEASTSMLLGLGVLGLIVRRRR